jgi:MoxR-like ATPase
MTRFEIIRQTLDGAVAPSAPVRLDLTESATTPFGPYVLSPDLATTVNVALALDQPLLVTGEPGCGKTSLAWAVAEQLKTEVLEFHVKSTSVARDLLYTLDNLRRFHDASAGIAEAREAARYITYQALGQAIQSDRTMVVLIDEIDKAPRDFPNDLLNELDRMEFKVHEVNPAPHFQQKVRHFVLITSNSERRLPMPFLRRCTYAHLDFPDETMLRTIVALHTRPPSDGFAALAVKRFLELRGVDGLVKPPATSELIGWVRVLERMGIGEDRLAKAPLGELPALEALVKMLDDVKSLRGVTAGREA